MIKHEIISDATSFTLNIIRIFSSWLVLIGHGFFYFGLTIFKNQEIFPALQNIGVVSLFILAGFLSGYSIERKKDNPQYSFFIYLIEKICRIWSGLLPALLFITLLDRLALFINPERYHYIRNFNIETFLGNIFFLQNFFSYPESTFLSSLTKYNIAPFGSGRPLWTLSVEWWIYMAVGYLFFIVIPSIRKKSFSFKNLLLLVLISWQPIEFLVGRETGTKVNLTFFFIVGYFIFLIYRPLSKFKKTNYKIIFLSPSLFLITIIVGLLIKNAYNLLFVISLSFLFLSLILFGESSQWRYVGKLTGIASFFAGYTYSLYLIHYSIIDFFAFNITNLTNLQKFLFSFFLSHFVAIIMYFLFERHGKALSIYFINLYRNSRT